MIRTSGQARTRLPAHGRNPGPTSKLTKGLHHRATQDGYKTNHTYQPFYGEQISNAIAIRRIGLVIIYIYIPLIFDWGDINFWIYQLGNLNIREILNLWGYINRKQILSGWELILTRMVDGYNINGKPFNILYRSNGEKII